MSRLLSLQSVSHSFGMKTLFQGLTFSIEENERIGLIGPNGAGKSTLLKIIAGNIEADSGDRIVPKGLRIGFLEQSPLVKEGTIREAILENTPLEDWEAAQRAEIWISKLGLDQWGAEFKVKDLSGGWKKRVALARELLIEPELLLLDEPTNHLDIAGVMWLEEFLRTAPFSVVTITHDRLFLNRVSNRIMDLNPRYEDGFFNVSGNYSSYLKAFEEFVVAQEKKEETLKNTLRRETEWLRQGAKARTTKQKARIERAEALGETVQQLTQRNRISHTSFEFQSGVKNPKRLIEVKDLKKQYGNQVIFEGVHLTIQPGSRIGLLGNNGAGKSTLLKVLLGKEPPSSGSVFLSDLLKVAYFDQHKEDLYDELTIEEVLSPQGDHVVFQGRSIHVRSYMDRFLFGKHQANFKVNKLSGGEKSRLWIARLMLQEANVLVLDEPTNDLDLATLNVLEDCLKEFSGAVLLVSHDRYFLDQISDQILAFPEEGDTDRHLTSYADFSQWEENLKKKQENFKAPPSPDKKQKKQNKKKKLGFNETRELATMEERILALESELEGLTTESTLPENLSNAKRLLEMTDRMAELQSQIDQLYQRWSDLESGDF